MPRPNKGPQVWYRKDRGTWGVGEFREGKRHWIATGLGSREDAQRELVRIFTKKDRASGKHTAEERIIGDVLASYQLEHGQETLHPDGLIYACQNLSPFWGDKRVSEITNTVCQEYRDKRRDDHKNKRGKNLSDGTVRIELATLKAALNHDYKEGRLLTVPYVWMPGPTQARERWLTIKEAAKLLKASRSLDQAKNHLPLFIIIGLYTGARKEAVLSLRWNQIDLSGQLINFKYGLKDGAKGRSVVPIPKKLLRELKKAKKRGTDIGYVIHENQKRLKYIHRGFDLACEKAGLEGVTPHTLRHTAASWMVQKGVPVNDVAKYLGHSSVHMVEKHYGHMAPEHLKRAKESYG